VGYSIEARSHNAVAAAIEQGRADWGVAIETVARQSSLGFTPLREECFDFVIPEMRVPALPVQRFLALLGSVDVRNHLRSLTFRLD
jgi:putative molybdopterin biosynthesis protein